MPINKTGWKEQYGVAVWRGKKKIKEIKVSKKTMDLLLEIWDQENAKTK